MAAVLVIAGGVTAAVLLRGPDQVAVPQVVVTLEPVGNSGPDPFVGVKGVSPVKAISDPVRSVAAATATSLSRDETTGTLSTAGTTDNLYGGAQSTELFGGSGNLGECDVPKLAEFLAANPDKARAWAEVRGIAPERISAYLQSLTPVVLLQDTLVTNYGFSGGVATPRQSVLQAGTAVLVDATGQPVVRCACGNPLTAPATINLPSATVQGSPWVGYDPARAVLVKSAPAATELVLVDVSTGESYPQLVGAAEPTATTNSPAPSSAAPSSATESTSAAADCAFTRTWPEPGPGWVDAADSGFTCAEMISRWQAYEQWPGERAGTGQFVDFPDGSYCAGGHPAVTTDSTVVGACELDGRRFLIYRGEFGQRTVSGADPSPSTATTTDGLPAPSPTAATGSVVVQDSLITPSNNITCAIIDGHFHCTIIKYDFAIGPCTSARNPFISLEPTGPASMSPCLDNAFVTAGHDPSTYGTSYQLGQILCDVEESGVRCTNPEGHGFTLNRAAFTPF